MRILDVSPRLLVPPLNGSSVRIFHLLRHLSERHEVRAFSQPTLHEARRPGFEPEARVTAAFSERRCTNALSAAVLGWCARSWITTPIFAGEALRVVRPRRLRRDLAWADACLVEFPWQLAYCRRERPAAPVVLVAHNVEAATRASNASGAGIDPDRSLLVRYVARIERAAVRAADLVVAVSRQDADELVARYEVAPGLVHVVPNGADTEAFVPVAAAERSALRRRLGLADVPTALYLAAIPKVPDLRGLDWVRRVAGLVPEVQFLVVGGISARPFREANLTATGLVEDPVPYAQAADASLAPIAHGGGTKIKVFDAVAAGLPTLVFAEAIRGTELLDGTHVLVCPHDPAALAAALRRVLADRDLAARLAVAGRAHVVERHDWGVLARALERSLLAVVGARRATSD